MANGLRVLLSPIPRPNVRLANEVRGVHVSLTTFGAGKSLVPDTGQVPAVLKLHARYLSRVREEQATPFQLFASLTGKLELCGRDKQPIFFNDRDGSDGLALVYEEPIDAEETTDNTRRPRRVFGLQFAVGQFQDTSDSEGINEHLVLPREPDGKWHHAEVQAELEVGGAPEAALGTTGIVDIPLVMADSFPLPTQKTEAVLVDEPASELILLVDASAVAGQGAGVATDASPPAPAPPPRVAKFVEGPSVPPNIKHDHGFLDDGNGNIDTSKFDDPTIGDRLALAKWIAQLRGAQVLRFDLTDACDAYEHYLFGGGSEFSFSYERFVSQDTGGKQVLDSAVEDTVNAAVALHESKVPFTPDARRVDQFDMMSDVISVGSDGRYPYPATENWQKAIGGHAIWLSAQVSVVTDPETGRHFDIAMALHAEDMYNFNPNAVDIATGTPDSENGRFQITRQAHEFLNRSSLTRRISTELGPFDASTPVDSDDIVVSGPPIIAPPAPGVTPPSAHPPPSP